MNNPHVTYKPIMYNAHKKSPFFMNGDFIFSIKFLETAIFDKFFRINVLSDACRNFF